MVIVGKYELVDSNRFDEFLKSIGKNYQLSYKQHKTEVHFVSGANWNIFGIDRSWNERKRASVEV